jgi:hypothetical protein
MSLIWYSCSTIASFPFGQNSTLPDWGTNIYNCSSSQGSDVDDDPNEDESDNRNIQVNMGNQISIGGGGKCRANF